MFGGVRYIRFYDVDVKKNIYGVLSTLENKIDEIVRTPPLFKGNIID